MKKDKNIEINETNYKDYIELYKLKLNSIDKASDIVFGAFIVLTLGLLGSLAVTSLSMFPINFITTFLLMLPVNKIISVAVGKTMEKNFTKTHPNINSHISLDELENALQKEKILDEVYQLNPENYEVNKNISNDDSKSNISDYQDNYLENILRNNPKNHEVAPKVYKKVKKN